LCSYKSWNGAVCIVTRLWAEQPRIDGSIPGRDKQLLSRMYKTALEPTQSPVYEVPGIPPLGIKRPKGEPDYSSPCSAKVKHEGYYTVTDS
jgi:hypothetical protein